MATGTAGLCLSTAPGRSTKAASSYPFCSSGKGKLSPEENNSFPTPPACIFAAFWSKYFSEHETGVCLGFFSHYMKQSRVSGIGSLQILFLWQESNHSSQGFYISKQSLCRSDCQKLFMASWLPCSKAVFNSVLFPFVPPFHFTAISL